MQGKTKKRSVFISLFLQDAFEEVWEVFISLFLQGCLRGGMGRSCAAVAPEAVYAGEGPLPGAAAEVSREVQRWTVAPLPTTGEGLAPQASHPSGRKQAQ